MACMHRVTAPQRCPLPQALHLRIIPNAFCPACRTSYSSLPVLNRVSLSRPRMRSPRLCSPSAYLVEGASQVAEIAEVSLPLVGGVLGGLVLTFIGYRAAVYARIQYITAALIGNQTPPDAAQVLEIGIGGGKNLYYYPKGVGTVLGVDPSPNEELLNQSAIQAGVILDFRRGSAESMDIQSNSMDAVVSTYTLGCLPLPARERVLKEVARVLKPGAPFLYVEMLRGACKGTLELIEGCADFTGVEYDAGWATNSLDPHAIGVAKKRGVSSQQAVVPGSKADQAIEELENKLRKPRKRGSSSKGIR
eukprot:CAMPEP_0196583290 /NCGR_PEP_ID=MMETSP1081-20130531/42866_1 /TAXON_ID=36882 /ORGANISM="Pyramimonas amylifera, Strain CCMP720" /LENGTH=305 /DNA_ID=CAMNT_0041904125 /DNA_START=93 /DNA_END=1010 /DNA_ORIENTATION=+